MGRFDLVISPTDRVKVTESTKKSYLLNEASYECKPTIYQIAYELTEQVCNFKK